MKPISVLMLAVFALASCKNDQGQQPSHTTVDSAPVAEARKASVYIKDSSQYDTSFISGLSYGEPIRLIDAMCIVGNDTVGFPNDLPTDSATVFKGAAPGNSFALTVTRSNFTNIVYTILVTDTRKNTTDSLSGTAVLKSSFFLASEVDYDPEEEQGFGSSEYLDKKGTCDIIIRIGIGPDEKGRKRATIFGSCPNNSKLAVSLNDSPILRTE